MQKTKLDTNMEEILGINPNSVIVEGELVGESTAVSTTVEPEAKNEKLEGDFEKSRTNLAELQLIGKEALNYALSVAKQTDDPKAYEAFSSLLKQLADMSGQILDLHLKEQKHKLQAAAGKTQKQIEQDKPGQVTNNAIFVGSTAELTKFLSKQHEEKDVTSS